MKSELKVLNSGDIAVSNAVVMWKNFAGNPDKFNKAGGDRNFTLRLDEEMYNTIKDKGFNIKMLNRRDDDVEDHYALKIKIGEKPYPKVIMISGRNHKLLDKDTVGLLDEVMIDNVDLQFKGWAYEVGGRRGLSAYLSAIYVTIQTDEFVEKYEYLEEDSYIRDFVNDLFDTMR